MIGMLAEPPLPHVHDLILLPGCGHWVQQERPAAVTAALVDLLGQL